MKMLSVILLWAVAATGAPAIQPEPTTQPTKRVSCGNPPKVLLTGTTEPTTQPVTQQAKATTTQPATQTKPAPEAERILDIVEAGAKRFASLSAEVTFTEDELIFKERSVYSGQVYYQKDLRGDKPARFRIHFDKFISGRVPTAEDRDYLFLTDAKGQWFVSRNARTKQIVRYHMAPPGKRIDLLALGQGPFPMPFGQRKADVLKMFEVTTRPPTRGDPANTTYLKLVPRPQAATKFEADWIELWINPDGLPVKIRTENTEAQVRKTAAFSKIAPNPKLNDKLFVLPPTPNDWTRSIELLTKPE